MVTPRNERYDFDADTRSPLLEVSAAPAWQADALCQEPAYPTSMFFDNDPAPALAVCSRCLVRETCAEWAIAEGIDHGVLGGLDAAARAGRRRLQAKRNGGAS
jgi:hypothetical protein